jgi:hypothetical protein
MPNELRPLSQEPMSRWQRMKVAAFLSFVRMMHRLRLV